MAFADCVHRLHDIMSTIAPSSDSDDDEDVKARFQSLFVHKGSFAFPCVRDLLGIMSRMRKIDKRVVNARNSFALFRSPPLLTLLCWAQNVFPLWTVIHATLVDGDGRSSMLVEALNN